MNLLQSLQQRGQSVWLDGFERGWITSGQLQHSIDDDGLRGVLSNFQSLQTAIQGQEYDRDFSTLARQGSKLSARQYYDYVVMRDLQLAADLLKQTYTQTHGRDGYVQVDLPPYSLLQAETAIAEAQKIWQSVGWCNLMLRIPATQIMLPVIEQLISDRINVNATSVFSQTTYEQVFNAYLRGLEILIQQNEFVNDIVCFTSFPVGHLDTGMQPYIASSLETTAFVMAQAKLLYQHYCRICQSAGAALPLEMRLRALRQQAKPPRLVWDCTGMQPQDAWRYVQALAVPETAIVLSQSTLETYSEVSLLPTSRIDTLEETEQILASLPPMKIPLDEIANRLFNEEIARSMKDFDQLLNTIERKRSN
jgi:transaldolase